MALQSRKFPMHESFEERSKSILEFAEWVSSDDCRGLDDIGLVAETARRLVKIGLPLDRIVLHLMTLHPDVIGRSIAWAPKEPVEVYDSRNGSQLPAGRLRSALDGGELLMAAPDNRWEQLDIYLGRSLTKLILAPLTSGDGLLGVLVFGTTHARGFDEAETALLERLVPVLRTAIELRLLKQTELGLLDTHVGARTAGRVLAQRVRNQEVESTEAALLLFDFHLKSEQTTSAEELIVGLDQARSTAIDCAKERGAEIIDLSAGRLLAVFPSGEAKDVAQRAVVAAMDASDQFSDEDGSVDVAISVHFGELTYGSVKSAGSTRLAAIGTDFQIIDALSTVRRTRPNLTCISKRAFELLGERGDAAVSELQIVDDGRIAKHVSLVGS